MEGRVEIERASLRDFLSAERTFLAWIRTGLALMGFGFVMARFGIFLQEVRVFQHQSTTQLHGPSLWFGTALIGTGVIVNLFSAWHHIRLVRELDRGDPVHSRPSTPAILIALFLASVGMVMAIYLLFSAYGSS